MSGLLTLSINIIFYCAGVATSDPGEAPPLAGFNMKSSVAYIALVRLFFLLRHAGKGNTAKRAESAKSWRRGGEGG